MIIAPHVGFSTYYYSIDGTRIVKAFYRSSVERLEFNVLLCCQLGRQLTHLCFRKFSVVDGEFALHDALLYVQETPTVNAALIL
mgnify:CR=1 FL=1